MSEWWTYRPSDLLMFSPETYYRLFALHNDAVWPAQIVAFAIGLVILAMLVWRPSWAGRAVAMLLAASWAFVAWSYFARYATINIAAPYFAWAFYIQAALLLIVGTLVGKLTFEQPDSWTKRLGLGLFAFALLGQPLIAPLAGRSWTEAELFGITPDPTVLATLGLLLAATRIRWELLLIPLLWCAMSGVTLCTMGAGDALLLPAAGLLTLILAAITGLHLRR